MENPEKKGLFGWLKRPAVRWAVLILGCAGILLIGLSEWLPAKETAAAADTDAYVRQLTQQLESLLGHVNGVGNCRVMVTLETGEEAIYAEDESESSSFSEETGTAVKKSGNENRNSTVVLSDGTGLLVTQIQPTVRGVAVICEGGGREEVRAAVIEAVTTVLNISARRVCVIQSS